ncbi:MAG: type IV toxin-antitoxin system AbiEi family antitoxin [Planctomycetaceae bacterium]
MKTQQKPQKTDVPIVSLIQRIGRESGSFDIQSVVEKQLGRREMRWDAVVNLALKPGDRKVDVFVDERKQLIPQTALKLFEERKWLPPDGVLLICAPYISPRVAELCREHDINYLDAAGNCRIVAPGLFIQISGRPNVSPRPQGIVDPFSRKSSRIVRTMLAHPTNGWQVQELAEAADVSIGLVSKVKSRLIEDAYIEERSRRLFLRDPAQLLKAWVDQYHPHIKRWTLFSMLKTPEIETRLAEWCRDHAMTYALTQLSAAWRYSPMVRYDRTVAYIDNVATSEPHRKSLLNSIDAREVDTGSNCTLWLTDDPATFDDAIEIDGVKVVSPLQLYLDLKKLSGRGEEAAQEILEKKLGSLLSDSQFETKANT